MCGQIETKERFAGMVYSWWKVCTVFAGITSGPSVMSSCPSNQPTLTGRTPAPVTNCRFMRVLSIWPNAPGP